MTRAPRHTFHVAAEHQPAVRVIGLDAEAVFTHADVKPWRKLPDRENCTLDADLGDGRTIRWHVKRYQPTTGPTTPADEEVAGHRLLVEHDIPTAPLVGWGNLADGRSFVITE